MNTRPIAPARIAIDADGTPRSLDYDDIYHPQQGALAQAMHVFLQGNGLPARWRGRRSFVVLETGFGLGNNFLATWAAWQDDADRCGRLHFISIEAQPLRRADLDRIARDSRLAGMAAELARQWPPLTHGMHRLVFADGAVELLLALGDVAAWLPQVTASVDAFYFDGFAPARNPAMWDVRLYRTMARLAAPGATAATWSAARGVRDGLRSAGFDVHGAAGSGGKRDITLARFAPRFEPRTLPRRSAVVRFDASCVDADVVIVGAGLAGCLTASALADAGVRTLVLEQGDDIATRGSGNAAGIFHGVVHRIDGRHARLHRSAALAAQSEIGRTIALHSGAQEIAGEVAGVLRLAGESIALAQMQSVLDALGLPPDYVRAVSADEASAIAAAAIAVPAWFYPGGGWVDPRALARDALARAGGRSRLRLATRAASMRRDGDEWVLRDAAGRHIAAAPVVVFANAGDASSLLGRADAWPLTTSRGQTSSVVADDPALVVRVPVVGSGYVLPPIEGRIWFGATSRHGDIDPLVRNPDHTENLARLARLLPRAASLDAQSTEGRVGFRCATIDRLPLIGAVPAEFAAASAVGMHLPDAIARRREQAAWIARATGLFVFAGLGSRGIATAILGARVLASQITGSPSPLEADLLDAVDPARFLSRAWRRGESQPASAGAAAAQPPEGPIAGSADDSDGEWG